MAGRAMRQCLHDVSAYLILLVSVSTLGPLQYGFHIVRSPLPARDRTSPFLPLCFHPHILAEASMLTLLAQAELNAPEDVITCRKKSISTTASLESARQSDTPGIFPECIPMNSAAFATVSASYTIGGLIGALCAGPIASRSGRLFAMRANALLYVLGAVVETIAGSVMVLAVGRGISGLGAGASTVIVPLYISEIAPPKERGLFGVMTQISICVGILLSQTLGYFLSYGHMWRWILGLGACIAAAQAILLLFLPESPAWLANRGRITKAKKILQRIRGRAFDITEEVQDWGSDGEEDAERVGLLGQSDAPEPPNAARRKENTGHLGFIQVVQDPLYRPAIVAVVGIMFAQQFCGINTIIMYSVSLLANLLPISSALLTIIVSLANLVTTIVCSPLPDRLGRKTCLLISIIGQGTSALVLAISILMGVKVLSAFAVLFFVGFFAVGLGPVPFMIAAELVGQEAVGATQSWCLAANYVSTFIVVQFFPIINNALNNALGRSGWVYFIFTALAACSAVFVSWKVPETKGKKDPDDVWARTRRLD